jgi:hypothetical protein
VSEAVIDWALKWHRFHCSGWHEDELGPVFHARRCWQELVFWRSSRRFNGRYALVFGKSSLKKFNDWASQKLFSV